MVKILGVTDPAKIMGIDLANIARMMGVTFAGVVVETHSGASFWPTYPGLIALDGAAAIRFEGVDISPFAGVAGSSTPYRIDLYDSALKLLSGYLAEADGAEALGVVELVPNGNMELDAEWVANGTPTSEGQSAVQAHGGTKSWEFTVDLQNEGIISSTDFTTTTGKLYKAHCWIYPDDTTNAYLLVRTGDASGFNVLYDITGLTQDNWNEIVYYYIEEAGGALGDVRFRSPIGQNSGTWYIDDVSIKEVTALGADGCHIVSAKNGATPNWASQEAGFDYNDSSGYTFNIVST